MKATIKYTALLLFLAISFSVTAQESSTPDDFDFPQNTTQATKTYASFSIPQQALVMQSAIYSYTFYNGRLTKYQREDNTYNRHIEESYTYKNDQLKSKEIIRQTSSGLEYTTYKYRIETEGNTTTRLKINHTGEVDKIIEFRNEAGELRGKSFYNTRGQRTQYIEYGGKEGHRIKKFHNEALVSDVIYRNNEHGRIAEIITHTMPGDEAEAKVLKTISYNDKGDAVKMLEYLPAKDSEKQNLNKTYYMDYLYDGNVWVAKIEYSNTTKDPGKLTVTIRSVVIGNRVYKPQNDEQLIGFCRRVYQNYLKLKQN